MDLAIIRRLCSEHKLEWTLHGTKRLLQRKITAEEIDATVMNGDIIEEYADDFPFPSCLIFGITPSGKKLHVLCAVGDDKLWIITAYEPNQIDWDPSFKTRRRLQ